MYKMVSNYDRDKIKNAIKKHDVGSRFTSIPLRKASVLLPVFIKQGKPYLLLTVRSMKLKTMPGDVCFPGGQQEATDRDDIETALREAKEEIGLCPEQSPRYLITPVVAMVQEPFHVCLDPDEVTEVFMVPLDFFINCENYTSVYINLLPFGTRKIHNLHYEDKQKNKTYKIWGLTAHFAVLLAVILLEQLPLYDSSYDLKSILMDSENYLIASSPSKL
ncbi:hypothetical protein GDO86_008366 [Hymenochirus boettgeri]|uniref:Nudix hydrolase domain-containing protein n=1 Tax=Hymenochirus boettgeri TaxID=247094 RepID=A0A8T2J1B9_9PIPI|nr:hypothetical protein GDO86_008366 [Hymenochirus boettgeri]